MTKTKKKKLRRRNRWRFSNLFLLVYYKLGPFFFPLSSKPFLLFWLGVSFPAGSKSISHLKKSLNFSLAIVGGGFFLYLHWFSLSFLWVWNRPDYQPFSGKESPQLHSCSLSGNCSYHQSYRPFRYLFCIWQFLTIRFLASSGSYCDCFGVWDFPRIFLEGTHSKRESYHLSRTWLFTLNSC